MSASRTTFCLTVLAVTACCLATMPAHAQTAPTFYNMNSTIIKQMAAVPPMFKQITVLIGVLTTYIGLHGFYKGASDPRSAAHLKNFFLLLVGGMFLSIGFLAMSAEKNVFGDTDQPEIRGSNILNNQMDAFH